MTEILAELLRQWSAEAPPGEPIGRTIVHKDRSENVLLARAAEVEAADGRAFLAQMHVDRGHAFFFEHPTDHVPGLMLIEAARQCGTAVMHLFYDLPEHVGFVVTDMAAGFDRYVEADAPAFIHLRVTDEKYRSGRLGGIKFHAEFLQDGDTAGWNDGGVSFMWWSRDETGRFAADREAARRVASLIPG